MITIVKPDKKYEKEVFAYKSEMIQNGDTDLNGCGSLERFDDFDKWVEHIDTYKDRNSIPKESGYVEGSQWLLVDTSNDRVLGMVNIRHYLNDFLKGFGGHIGYSIRPSERRKGYSKLQLNLALQHLKKLGETKALVTCDINNVGSYKSIESCGGVLENIIDTEQYGKVRRYWIDLQSNT